MVKVLSFSCSINLIIMQRFPEITRQIKNFAGNKYLAVFSHENNDGNLLKCRKKIWEKN